MKKLVLFNHKGGVGKTTLSVNIGFSLARSGKRVLLIDADPQASLTSYLMEGHVFDELLDHSSEDKGRTIWTSVMPLANGKSEHDLVEPFETYVDGLYYLPGDLRLSEFENTLASSWSGARAQEPHDLAVT